MPRVVVEVSNLSGSEERYELELGDSVEILRSTTAIDVSYEWDEEFWGDRPTDPDELGELVDAGLDVGEIADRVGVSRSTVSRWLQRCGL